MDEKSILAEEMRDDGIPLWAVELGCWTMVALAPFLYWVNGPAVSTDQFVVRTTVVALALAGGVTIRVFQWRRGRKTMVAKKEVPAETAQGAREQAGE